MLTKSEATAIMKELPVTLPYRDWNSLRALPATVRHTLATNVLTETTDGIDDIRALGIDVDNHLPAFTVARWMAGKRFVKWLDAAMDEKQTKSAPEFFSGLDFDTSIITRIRRKQRPFSIPVSALEAVCNMMHLSVHNLLFGEKGVLDISVFPSLNTLVRELNTLDDEVLVQLAADAKLAVVRYKKELSLITKGESGHCMSVNKLLANRFAWYTRENNLRPIQVFGRTLDSTPHRVHSSIYNIYGEKQYEAKLPVLMEAALSCNLAIDFFVKDDPTTFVTITVAEKDGKTTTITSQDLKTFLACVFLLDDERRNEVVAQAWNAVFAESDIGAKS